MKLSTFFLAPVFCLLTAAGLFAQDSHSLDAVDGTPEDAVFVDAEGNVGAGTTQPTEKLSVEEREYPDLECRRSTPSFQGDNRVRRKHKDSQRHKQYSLL